MTHGNFILGSRSDDDMELDDAAFNQPLEDLVKEKAVSLLIELRAKGNIPYTESLDFIRRLSTFIDILISSTLKSFNQTFLGVSEVNEVFEKVAAFNDQLEMVKSALLDLDSETNFCLSRTIYGRYLIGINEAFGFITCFTADYVCPLCYGTKEQFQMFFRESQFPLRTLDQYNEDISKLSDLPLGQNYHGVKNTCDLNE